MRPIILLSILTSIILSGCITQDKCYRMFPPSKHDSLIVKYVTKDTIWTMPMDSVAWQLYMACYDENGRLTSDKIRLTDTIEKIKGKNVRPVVYVNGNNVVTVKCIVDSAQVYKSWVEKHVTQINKEEPKEIRVNFLSGWQWFQVWCGRILFVLIFGAIAYIAIKFAKKV